MDGWLAGQDQLLSDWMAEWLDGCMHGCLIEAETSETN